MIDESVIASLSGDHVTPSMDPGGAPTETRFIFTVKTDNAGTSSSDQFTLPLDGLSTYNFDWETSDGQSGTHVVNTNLTITFPSDGTYTVYIGGTNNTFPRIKFNNAGDKLKILDVSQWGNIEWNSIQHAFYGCSNLTVSASDMPDFSAATSAQNAFFNCTSLISLPAMDLSSATSMHSFCRGCTSLASVGAITTGVVTSLYAAFYQCGLLDYDASGFDISELTDASFMFDGSAHSQTNYDPLLIAWDGQAHNTGVSFHAGTAKYGAGAPATARAALVSDSWTITDGGPA